MKFSSPVFFVLMGAVVMKLFFIDHNLHQIVRLLEVSR